MRRLKTDLATGFLRARSIGMVGLFALLTASMGGLVGWSVSEGRAHILSGTPRSAVPLSEEAKKLASLRRSRLAFLNLGFNRDAPFLKELDKEISSVECSLKKVDLAASSSTAESAISGGPEVQARWGWIGAELGSFIGFVVGALTAVFYGLKRRGAKRRSESPRVATPRLQIPILGTIPEGAFKER